MSDRERVAERALAYPYRIPKHSFLQVGAKTLVLPPGWGAEDERTAVLAFGSNAAPEVLERKFASLEDVSTPVVRAKLHDFDVVYSAHISAYGSVPAALQGSPGIEVDTYVLHLTDDQLRVMSGTEPNYRLARLHDVHCKSETGESLTGVASYLSKHGCLNVDGSEAALASVTARDRVFRSMTQTDVLEYVRSELSPESTLEEFIEQNASDPELRGERTGVLAQSAKRFVGTDWELLDM